MSRTLLHSSATVGALTLLSRLLGFVRDMAIARLAGAGLGADAFLVAFRIPNFLRRLFAEGAFSQAFVPVLAETRRRSTPAELRALVDGTAGTVGLVLLGITAAAVAAAPLLILLFAPGFSADAGRLALATELLRITFPYLLFIGGTALAGAILNTFGNFWVPAFTPVLLNLAIIGAALGVASGLEQPVTALAWGVFLGGTLQLLFQLPFLARLRLLPRPVWRPRDPGVRRILRLMGPALLGVSAAQVNLLVDTLMASFLKGGSVSWLYYSDRLLEFPVGVFGLALATVMLPHLSREQAASHGEGFAATLDWGLRWLLFIGVPATLGLLLLSGPLLATLFQYGAFGATDTAMAARSLAAYGAGLCGFIGVKVLAPGFYARQNARVPLRIALATMALNLLLSLLLMGPLGHAGLALGTALAAAANAVLLLWALWRRGVYRPGPGWSALFIRVALASAVLAAVVGWMTPPLEAWSAWTGAVRAQHLTAVVAAGLAAYFAAAWLAGIRLCQLASPGAPEVG